MNGSMKSFNSRSKNSKMNFRIRRVIPTGTMSNRPARSVVLI
jgi:hypothetical protein